MRVFRFILPLLILISLLAKSTHTNAQTNSSQALLSQLSLFVRCYKHITNQPPATNLQQYIDVKSGTKTAVDACMEVLSSAAFNANGANEGKLISDTALSRRIVTNFHALHRSFFSIDDSRGIPDFDCRGNNINLHDTTVGALAFTRVLFNSGVNFSEIVTNPEPVEAIRSLGNPVITPLKQAQAPGSDLEADWLNVLGVSRGELTGVVPMSAVPSRFNQSANFKDVNSALLVHASTQRAGVLGSSAYIQYNHGQLTRGRANGALVLPRRLAKNVFSDFLCRSVPVIQLSDAAIYVQPGSSIPFRTQTSCMQCHASMDPMAAAWRNAQVVVAPNPAACGNGERTNHLVYHSATKPDSTLFPLSADPDFYQRPAKFMFHYRDSDGVLHRIGGVGLGELANVLLGLDDLYRCTATRYLKFFTGIDVALFDPADPSSSSRSTAEREYFELVKNLGASLKDHKRLDRLIREIISSPLYGTASQRNATDVGGGSQ